MKYFFGLLVALFSWVSLAFAQTGGCGTVVTPEVVAMEKLFQKQLKERIIPFSNEPVVLSLTAHLLHDNNGYGGLTENQLIPALEKLNLDYQPAGIQFAFCVKHINNSSLLYFGGWDSEDERTFIQQYNVPNSLNIYFVNVASLCGYAYFPTPSLVKNQQQLVIMNVACALNGSTLSHEVGHFFFLYHTHETAFGVELVDESNCSSAGDLLCDTPADPGLSYSTVTSDCQYVGNQRDPNGMSYTPQINNFMSYSVKECRNLFTANQYQRIRFGYDTYRTYLLTDYQYSGGGTSKTDTLTICAGQSIRLTAPKGISYQWETGETRQSVEVYPEVSTTYRVRSEQADGCPFTQTWVVQVVNKIKVSQNKATICPGSSAILTATGGTDYTWQPAEGLDHTVGATVKASPTRTITYTIQAKIGTCTVSDTMTVRVEVPKITLSRQQVSICAGNSVEIRAFGASRYEWQPQNSVNLSQNGAVASLSPTLTTTYTVRGFKDECSNTATVTVSVNNRQRITVTPVDTLVCYGERITLRASGGQNYRWSPAGDLSNPTDSVITVTAYRDMQYAVSADNQGCSERATVNIRIHEPMTATVDRKPVSAPNASDGEITVHVKGGTPPYLYSINGGAFQSDSVFRGLKVGMQKVVVKDGKGCERNNYCLMSVFVDKDCKNPNFEWTKSAGGNLAVTMGDICSDNNNHVYVTGSFIGNADFGDFSLISEGGYDIFVAKYDAFGNCLWVKKGGGKFEESGRRIITTSEGDVYIFGTFEMSSNFGNFNLTSKGENDIFIAKYDANGKCLWAKRAGGSVQDDRVSGVSIDIENNIYIIGSIQENANFGTFTLSCEGSSDIFLAKYDTSGNCKWAKRMGGVSEDSGYGISMDLNGNVYITGYYYMTANFGNFTLPNKGWGKEIFLAKYDTSGNCKWAKRSGGSFDDSGYGLTTDSKNNVYLIGEFERTADFGNFTIENNNSERIFIAKYDEYGNCIWVKKIGSGGIGAMLSKFGHGISINLNGNVYITGYFGGNMNIGNFELESKRTLDGVYSYDIFIAEYDAFGNCKWVQNAGGSGDDRGLGISIDYKNNMYISGEFTETANFGDHVLKCTGNIDIFLCKLSCSADTVAGTCTFTASAGSGVSVGCDGAGVRLQGSVSGSGATHEWLPADGLDDLQSLTPTARPRQTTTYTLVARRDTCTATAEVTVTVPKMTAFRLDNQRLSYCAGDSATVQILDGDSLTFDWTPKQGLEFRPPNRLVATTRETSVWQISGKRDGLCPFVTELTATVHPKPKLTLNSQATTGTNDGKITATATDGTPPYQFSLNGNPFTNDNVFVNLSEGTYTIRVQDAKGCENFGKISVKNCTKLTVDAGTNTTLCIGQSIPVNATISDTTTEYAIIWMPALGLNDANVLRPIANPLQTTTYTLLVSGANGCTAVDSVKIIILNLPTVNAGEDVVVCAGNSVQLSATASGTIYRWSPVTGLDNPNILNPTATPSKTTVYTLTVGNGSCETYDEVVVSVPLINLPNRISLCQKESTVLDAGILNADNYRWQPAEGLNNPNIATPTASPNRTITYSLTVQQGNCTLTDSVTVKIMQAEASPNVTICQNNLVQLWAKGGIRYSWTPVTGLDDPKSPAPIATPSQTTTYTVEVTDEYLCSDAKTVVVEVLTGKASPKISLGSVNNVSCSGCFDGSISVQASGGLPPYEYSLDNDVYRRESIFNKIGMGIYRVQVKDANGCTDDTLVQVGIIPTACDAPKDLKIKSNRGFAILSWSAVPNAEAYEITFRKENEAWQTVFATTNSVELRPLDDNVNYQIYVKCWCPNQTFSPHSDTLTFTQKTCELKMYISMTPVTCTGVANGTISVDSISGASEPFLYSLNKGSYRTEDIFRNLSAGMYRISVLSSEGCLATDSIVVMEDLKTIPQPTIMARKDTLWCNENLNYQTYQWFRNGSSVSPATVNNYFPTNRVNGHYDVRIVTSDGCILRSDKFQYEYSGLWSDETDEHIAIYPNPFTETTTLRYHLDTPSLVTIEVYNASGALIFSRKASQNTGTQEESITLTEQASGIYFLRIGIGTKVWKGIIVKE